MTRRGILRWFIGGTVSVVTGGAFAIGRLPQQGLGSTTTKDTGSKGSRCPICGCEANHCDAGIPAHLACSLSTSRQKGAIEQRKYKLQNVLRSAQSDLTTNCNQFVSDAARLYGYTGFEPVIGAYRSADDLHAFLEDKGATEGWTKVSGDQITQYANVGAFVIGVIDSKTVSDAKGVANPGHIFIIEPGGTYDDSGRQLKVVNAAQGVGLPRETTLSQTLSATVRNAGNAAGTLRYYAYIGPPSP